jgi:hypothetical protein
MTLFEAGGSNQYVTCSNQCVTCPLICTETVNVEQPLPKLEVAMRFSEEVEE